MTVKKSYGTSPSISENRYQKMYAKTGTSLRNIFDSIPLHFTAIILQNRLQNCPDQIYKRTNLYLSSNYRTVEFLQHFSGV